jgi:N-acetylglucosaminyldiphosphoundecaprenol N-acetyl-beta-D-mannosaminyltransferase
MSNLPLRKVRVLGYDLIDEPPPRIAAVVCDDMSSRQPRSYFFLNPHSIVQATGDPALQRCFSNDSELFCDGVGLSLANRVLNRRALHRVWGQDFFLAVSREISDRRQGRVFFLGGHADAIESLLSRYQSEFPGVRAVSAHSPAFKPEFSSADIVDMASRINAFRPDILWIGVGSPKQEKLLYELQPLCKVPCAGAIGAVFDFYCGRVTLGPKWIRDFGLLWAYRLIQEPRRLWRRTLISAPLFALRVLRELLLRPS